MSIRKVNYELIKSIHIIFLIYIVIKLLLNLFTFATNPFNFTPPQGATILKGALFDLFVILLYGCAVVSYWRNRKVAYYLLFMSIPFFLEMASFLLKLQLAPTLILQFFQLLFLSVLFFYLRKGEERWDTYLNPN